MYIFPLSKSLPEFVIVYGQIGVFPFFVKHDRVVVVVKPTVGLACAEILTLMITIQYDIYMNFIPAGHPSLKKD